MQNVSIQKAEDLSVAVKSALESLLGRPLEADEEVSVMAFRPHEAPQGPVREQLTQGLNAQMDAMAERAKDAFDDELEEILDDTMRSARPTYRPIK
jgi:hypothetical protein